MNETYVAYLLRLWKVGLPEGEGVWRASLEDPHSGEVRAFADLGAVLAFLEARVQTPSDAEAVSGDVGVSPHSRGE